MKNRKIKCLLYLGLAFLCLILAITGFTVLYTHEQEMIEYKRLKSGGLQNILWGIFVLGVVFMLLLVLKLIQMFARSRALRENQQVRKELESANVLLEEQKACIRRLSQTDALTNLYNRKQMQECIASMMRMKQSFYLLYIDLDNFKSINDIYGSARADEALKQIGDALLHIKQGVCLASRFGGDEFLILARVSKQVQINILIKEIQQIFETGFFIENAFIKPKISMGISLFRGREKSADELIQQSELAMLDVKKAGKNGWKLYDAKIGMKNKEKIRIEEILKKAIENQEFMMVYQPQIDVHSGKINSYEALLRIKGVEIYPNKFIPVAEESDLILDLGRIVLQKTIQYLSKRKELGEELKTIAVNFSSRQLKDRTYLPFLEGLLAEYDLEPEYVEIEVTESIVLQNNEAAQEWFSNFKRIGINLVLDDFGTGYASLEYLTYIPITKLKISKDLIDSFFADKKEEAIKNIINLAHSLGFKITVEGIEEKWKVDFLKENGCDFIQGYIFSRPVEESKIRYLENLNFLQEVL